MHKHGLCRCAVAGRLSVTFEYCVKTAKDTATVAMETIPSFPVIPFSITLSDSLPRIQGNAIIEH